LEFSVEDLFSRSDPLAEINDKYAAARLFTEADLASDWLEPAALRIVVGEPHVTWITSPGVVAAVVRGLANNRNVATRTLTQPRAVEYLLRRSALVEEAVADEIGELLVIAATASDDSRPAAQVAAAVIAAIGSGAVRPHEEVLPYVAIIGGFYLDELAYSLVDSVPDPTSSPRFVVSRATARVFFREAMRSKDAHANLLAATQAWVQGIVAPVNVTTFDEYAIWVQNKTDDVGRLLGAIISADEVIAVEKADELARRRAMLLDVVKALAQIGAKFTGPVSLALHPPIESLRNRADELLGVDYVRDAHYNNQLYQEALLDELDEALYTAIRKLGLTDASRELDPGEIELREGAVRSLLRSLIAAELLAYSYGDIRLSPD
jgi:hypothetical protein